MKSYNILNNIEELRVQLVFFKIKKGLYRSNMFNIFGMTCRWIKTYFNPIEIQVWQFCTIPTSCNKTGEKGNSQIIYLSSIYFTIFDMSNWFFEILYTWFFFSSVFSLYRDYNLYFYTSIHGINITLENYFWNHTLFLWWHLYI